MKNEFWSWKHLRPDSWLDLIYGVAMISASLMMVAFSIFIVIETVNR